MTKKGALDIFNEVISLALELMMEQIEDYKSYRWVGIEETFLNGSTVWKVTMKHQNLPNLPEEAISAGGELFIAVDLTFHKAWLIGYGE